MIGLRFIRIVCLLVICCCTSVKGMEDRPRIIVTTDGEADDRASFVRFLLTSNEFDVEAIVNSSSEFHWVGGKGWNAFHPVEWIAEYIGYYAQVYPNLLKHSKDYPSPDELLARWKVGNISAVGEYATRTEGARFIADILLDNSDSRPIWLQAWGGCNTIAAALKIIQEDHPERMAEVASRLRLYLIWEQDETYQQYIRPQWEPYGIPTIISDQFDCMAYIWPKVLPSEVKPYFEKVWMKARILEGHGPLCDAYPNKQGAFNAEGDTPAFLHTIPTGLRNRESPAYGGWGGRYVRVRGNVWMDPLPSSDYVHPSGQWGIANSWSKRLEHVTDTAKINVRTRYFKPLWRWLDAIQNDFAARADWCVEEYESANHPPVVSLAQASLDVSAGVGEVIEWDASGSTDPDGDTLSFRWWHYAEAGSYAGHVEGVSTPKFSFRVPEDARVGDTIHLICEVRDSGTPALTRYCRVIVTVVG